MRFLFSRYVLILGSLSINNREKSLQSGQQNGKNYNVAVHQNSRYRRDIQQSCAGVPSVSNVDVRTVTLEQCHLEGTERGRASQLVHFRERKAAFSKVSRNC